MDPIPSMSRAYYLVLQIEQQNEVSHIFEMSVFNLESKKIDLNKKFVDKKKADKRNMICD